MGLFKFAAPPELSVVPATSEGCKGLNCGCTDGVSHSPECVAQHEAISNAAEVADAKKSAEMKGTQTGRMSGIDTHKSNVPKPASKIIPTNEFAKAKITVPKPGNRQIVRNRVTGDSKAGRKLRAQNAPVVHTEVSPEIQRWNAEVEARKAAKVSAKISRGKE